MKAPPLAIGLLSGLIACGDRAPVPPSRDAGVGRRVFDPPTRKVRAVPPYNVHAGGVGPYKLGAQLRDVLALLPHGPRVELLQIDRVVDSSLVRTDGEKLVIGASRSARVVFVSVVAPGIAVTDDALEVGATREDVEKVLGAPPADQIADPRLERHAAMPGLRFVSEEGRVIGMVVQATGAGEGAAGAGEGAAAPPAAGDTRPARCAGRAESAAVLIAAARVKSPADAIVRPGCFGGDAEVLVVAGTEIAVVGGDPDKPRRLAGLTIDDLGFAAGLDVDADGRQEIVAVVQRVENDERVVRIHVLAVEGGRLTARTRDAGEAVYRVSSAAAAWVGAKVREIDLLLEVAAGRESLEIGGLYLRRTSTAVRDIAPLSPVTVALPRPRRRGGQGGDGSSSGPSPTPPPARGDAGSPAPALPSR